MISASYDLTTSVAFTNCVSLIVHNNIQPTHEANHDSGMEGVSRREKTFQGKSKTEGHVDQGKGTSEDSH